MTALLVKSAATYPQLVKAIRDEIAQGQKTIQQTQAQVYWKVGKLISQHLMQNKDRAEYGTQLFAKLSKSLDISEPTLHQSIKFYEEYPILNARSKLPWTHYRTLLSLPDPSDRRTLVRKALRQNLSSRQLQKEVSRAKLNANRFPLNADTPVPVLKAEQGTLYTYTIIADTSGTKFVDCGFDVWREVAGVEKFQTGNIVRAVRSDTSYKLNKLNKSDKPNELNKLLYTFQATVERIIDGDTLVVHVDLGFNTVTKQKLRLRGIDCPELVTPIGQKAKRFVQSLLKPNDVVVIKTHKDDKYGRYLADVFVPRLPKGGVGTTTPQHGAADIGVGEEYLNQTLLNNRLAILMKE